MANVNMAELEEEITTAVKENVTARDTLAANADAGASAFRPPPRMVTDPGAYTRRISAVGGSLETIKADWTRTLAEFEKAFDDHKRQLEAYATSVRATIDEMKRLKG